MIKKNIFKENYNKILEAVLLDDQLMEYADYRPDEITSLDSALTSDNPIVRTVAHIIDGMNNGMSEREIYNTINDFLKKNL